MARKKNVGRKTSGKQATPSRASKIPRNQARFAIEKATGRNFDFADPKVHIYGKKKKICSTNARGFSTPENRSPLEIVVDASDGFIPLWGENVTLRWRFNETSMQVFQNPEAAKNGIRDFLGKALLKWGDSAPVKFTETNDTWDFEFFMSSSDNCTATGCTLARAFFPDSGRHDLMLFPILFEQPEDEIVDTFLHELGHVFGLRHFFAQVSETAFPSEVFGTHEKFTIMNYGNESVLTDDDKSDLKNLYSQVWSGELSEINGTPIRLFRPFHEALESDVSQSNSSIAANCSSAETAMRELLIELLKKQ